MWIRGSGVLDPERSAWTFLFLGREPGNWVFAGQRLPLSLLVLSSGAKHSALSDLFCEGEVGQCTKDGVEIACCSAVWKRTLLTLTGPAVKLL